MTIKQIDQLLEEANSFKDLSVAFGELASLKIKKIRSEVERNRIFFAEIEKVYALIKAIASKRRLALNKPKTTVSVLLTSNQRFYGAITSQLAKHFIINTTKIKTDRVVVGKSGIEHLQAASYLHPYTPVILKNDLPTPEDLKNLATLVSPYRQVIVFYPELKSLLVQNPVARDISESEAEKLPSISQELLEIEKRGRLNSFIFEPEISKTLEFFDHQITTLLLEASFLESELARTASRLIAMDQAQVEANKYIKEYQKLRAYTKRSIDNNMILEGIAARTKKAADL